MICLFHMWERIKNAVTGNKNTSDNHPIVEDNKTVHC